MLLLYDIYDYVILCYYMLLYVIFFICPMVLRPYGQLIVQVSVMRIFYAFDVTKICLLVLFYITV